MRTLCLALALVLLPLAVRAAPGSSFDGKWTTTVTCPRYADALGYSYRFASRIADGVLHGERGDANQPGYFVLDGPVGADGAADLYARGLVGAADFAVGHVRTGKEFDYHVQAQFGARSGTGKRVEGRPCEVAFTR